VYHLCKDHHQMDLFVAKLISEVGGVGVVEIFAQPFPL
jgi:hypothetical protein